MQRDTLLDVRAINHKVVAVGGGHDAICMVDDHRLGQLTDDSGIAEVSALACPHIVDVLLENLLSIRGNKEVHLVEGIVCHIQQHLLGRTRELNDVLVGDAATETGIDLEKLLHLVLVPSHDEAAARRAEMLHHGLQYVITWVALVGALLEALVRFVKEENTTLGIIDSLFRVEFL